MISAAIISRTKYTFPMLPIFYSTPPDKRCERFKKRVFLWPAYWQFVAADDHRIFAHTGHEAQIDQVATVAARKIRAHFFLHAFERSILFERTVGRMIYYVMAVRFYISQSIGFDTTYFTVEAQKYLIRRRCDTGKRSRYFQRKRISVYRLDYKIEGIHFVPFCRQISHPRHEYYDYRGIQAAKFSGDFQSVHSRHLYVHQYDIVFRSICPYKAVSVEKFPYGKLYPTFRRYTVEILLDAAAFCRIVIDDSDLHHFHTSVPL